MSRIFESMTGDQSFPKEKRLLKRWEFDRTFEEGRVLKDENIVVYVAEGTTDRTRLGVVVGKKIKNATDRNRYKRVIRAGFRVAYEDLPKGYDMIVIPRYGTDLTGTDVEDSLRSLLGDF